MRTLACAAIRLPAPPLEIKFSHNYLECLSRLVQSKAVLKQNGYVLDELSAKDIERKRRCYRCGKYIQKGHVRTRKEKCDTTVTKSLQPTASNLLIQNNTNSPGHERQRSEVIVERPANLKSEDDGKNRDQKPVMRCRFHIGSLKRQFWNCCNQYRYSKGCQQAEYHHSHDYKEGELEAIWKYYTTPETYRDSLPRYAIALDCEMGINIYGESELIRLSVIDYFSSKVLIDSLVYPDIPMSDYNTRYSGVSNWQMENAYRQNKCFLGKDAAREAIWKFVGPKTIIVGHSANNDLTALRWIHERVIDTMLIEYLKFMEEQKRIEIEKDREKAKNDEICRLGMKNNLDKSGDEFGKVIPNNAKLEKPEQKSRGSGRFSLKFLTKERTGRTIQQGRSGHDSVEDAIASRDLAHWLVMNQGTNDLMSI